MPDRTPLPDHLSRAPFAVQEALAAGLPPSRMQARDLSAPYRGVRVPRGVTVTAVDAYARRMPPHQHFSQITAARLWRITLPGRLVDARLHVSATYPQRAPQVAGVVGHQALPDLQLVELRPGVRVSSVADTWRALATTLTLDELIIAGDSTVRRKNPLTSMAALEAAVLRATGSPGARRAREAFALLRPRTDSPRETTLRLLIIRSGLPEPVVNFTITNELGVFVAYGDLAYPQYKVLVEYDGGQHRDDEAQFNRDIDRLDDVMELTWRVIRVNKSHVDSRSAARIAKIRTALVERGWRP